MSASPLSSTLTYPKGFLDFLTLTPTRGPRVGDHELRPEGLERMNAALRALSPESPALTLDQMATAAQRAIDRHRDGQASGFVTSRLGALTQLRAMASDAGWLADAPLADTPLSERIDVIDHYLADPDVLLPPHVPVVGRLDAAVLVDVLLQLVREDFAEFEEFSRFRQVAAGYAGLGVAESGITRGQWLEALHQARDSGPRRYGRARASYAPDPRLSLFHVV